MNPVGYKEGECAHGHPLTYIRADGWVTAYAIDCWPCGMKPVGIPWKESTECGSG